MIRAGEREVLDLKLGTRQVNEVRRGEEMVWSAGPEAKPYLTFSSPQSFTLSETEGAPAWDGTLEYSTNGETWTEWDGSEISSGAGNRLYLRGTGNTYAAQTLAPGFDDFFIPSSFHLAGSNISCSGNIEMLLDYAVAASGGHPVMAEHCFASLFQDNDALILAPELPATTLSEGCYMAMFHGCGGLTVPPELPATVLAKDCYRNMFEYTAIAQSPELPATALTEGCYAFMFTGCDGLTSLPPLPATTLQKHCYQGMFLSCPGVKIAESQTGQYLTQYRIPSAGTGTAAEEATLDMFTRTGGSFAGTPVINTTYYTANRVI